MDTIGNMLVSLRNAGAIRKEKISVPFSKLTLSILNLLKEEGYVKAVKDNASEYKIEVVLEYNKENVHAVRETKRISKPGRRVYYKMSDIQKVRNGYGNVILSTPQGIMTGKAARAKNTGGEALFEIF
jgi:small subunit ribosomal protein S8